MLKTSHGINKAVNVVGIVIAGGVELRSDDRMTQYEVEVGGNSLQVILIYIQVCT